MLIKPIKTTTPAEVVTAMTQKMKPMVSFCFDDGYISDYTKAFPYFREKGIRATFFPVSSRIGDSGRVTAEQWVEMVKVGHEVGSHTVNHARIGTLTRSEMIPELLDSKLAIQEITGQPCRTLGIPNGDYSVDAQKMLGGFYEAARSSDIRNNPYGHSNSFIYGSHFLDNPNMSVASIKALIDTAVSNKEWIILSMHSISEDTDTTTGWKVRESNFKEIVDYVDSLRPSLEVVTFYEGHQRIKGQMSISQFQN